MGDVRRFDLFADLIERNFPAHRYPHIADVASGKGLLQAALRQRGYRNIVSWDKRKRNAGGRKSYRYGYFDCRNAPRDYDLVFGMHPDEATDHIVLYATRHRCPFIVCPCCVKPSASKFQAIGFDGWMKHLISLAESGKMAVTVTALPMHGKNQVIIGRPAKKAV
jgi:hypothetical protein